MIVSYILNMTRISWSAIPVRISSVPQGDLSQICFKIASLIFKRFPERLLSKTLGKNFFSHTTMQYFRILSRFIMDSKIKFKLNFIFV